MTHPDEPVTTPGPPPMPDPDPARVYLRVGGDLYIIGDLTSAELTQQLQEASVNRSTVRLRGALVTSAEHELDADVLVTPHAAAVVAVVTKPAQEEGHPWPLK